MKRQIISLVILWLFTATGCSSLGGSSALIESLSSDPLVSGLTSSLGLDTKQAAGGLGSLLSLAENKLPGADYESLSRLLPGSSKYLEVAQDAGILSEPITDVRGLNSAMGELDITPSQASQLVGQVSDFVGKAGGESAKNLLQGLVK